MVIAFVIVATVMGVFRSVTVPSPNWPNVLSPHALIAPPLVSY